MRFVDTSRSRTSRQDSKRSWSQSVTLALGLLLVCLVGTMVILNTKIAASKPFMPLSSPIYPHSEGTNERKIMTMSTTTTQAIALRDHRSVLDGIRILVAIAAFDFSQLPHLEEVLDSYHDLCVAGSKVDVVIHATVAYPVSLIDLLNSRLMCTNPSPLAGFSVTIVIKSKAVRLHLVDFHRTLFYDKIDEYDLFVFSEDDIRVTPKTLAAYLHETERVATLVGPDKASDFNVGIARYEYNYPPDVVIDDNSRGVTQDVTRVYWEHSWKPPIPKSVDMVPQAPLSKYYVHMTNHHQGMFMATRDLLKAWQVRPGCQFDVVRDRPALKDNPNQPSEGTQRVWMSSQMLYGNKHCNVQQVIPMDKFGTLTVLHLPNKNYRRVGKKGRLGGHDAKEGNKVTYPDVSEIHEGPSKQLLTAMELHIEMRRRWPAEPQLPYNGIQMVDEATGYTSSLIEQRLRDFQAYVARGGVMSEEDMAKVDLEGEYTRI